jgi:mRNA-degrading endonuclease RelE of RelBE toxin-antitoxin system
VAYQIRALDQVALHLRWLTARDRATVLRAIPDALRHEPAISNRNRKRMRDNDVAQYRLRVGRLRVYYDVDEARRLVVIVAVGIKVREKVLVGGLEIDL